MSMSPSFTTHTQLQIPPPQVFTSLNTTPGRDHSPSGASGSRTPRPKTLTPSPPTSRRPSYASTREYPGMIVEEPDTMVLLRTIDFAARVSLVMSSHHTPTPNPSSIVSSGDSTKCNMGRKIRMKKLMGCRNIHVRDERIWIKRHISIIRSQWPISYQLRASQMSGSSKLQYSTIRSKIHIPPSVSSHLFTEPSRAS